jgi:NACalpha-BTF3-like transcription factor
MKMGNLYKDVTSKFERYRKQYSNKTDEEICEMVLIKSKQAKSGNPLYGGKLSAEDICAIRVNKALQKLSEISDARGESMRTTHNKIVSEITEADIDYFMKKDGISEEEARDKLKSSNGPHTETVVRTFMQSMHWTRSIMGDADTEMLQSVGNTHVKSKYYRECLASLTGYDGDITTPDGRDGLINYLAKSVKITPGNGSVQFVNNKTGQTILLGEDTWRTAGDGEKIAGHDGVDLIKCLKSKKNKEK